jgi:hypothetical protein
MGRWIPTDRGAIDEAGSYRDLSPRLSRDPGAAGVGRQGRNDRRSSIGGAYGGPPLRGLTLQLNAKMPKSADAALDLELQIEPSQIAFGKADGHHVASLELAVWVTDKEGNEIGAITDHIDLQLTDDTYAKLRKQNIAFTRRIPVTGKPFEVRVGVYDYDNDRLGGVSKRIQ